MKCVRWNQVPQIGDVKIDEAQQSRKYPGRNQTKPFANLELKRPLPGSVNGDYRCYKIAGKEVIARSGRRCARRRYHGSPAGQYQPGQVPNETYEESDREAKEEKQEEKIREDILVAQRQHKVPLTLNGSWFIF